MSNIFVDEKKLLSIMKNIFKNHHSADKINKAMKIQHPKMNKSSNQQYFENLNMANKVKTFPHICENFVFIQSTTSRKTGVSNSLFSDMIVCRVQ